MKKPNYIAETLKGPKASLFFAWLASHRRRQRLFVLGGSHIFVIVGLDRYGKREVKRTRADEQAMYQLTYGDPPPKGGAA